MTEKKSSARKQLDSNLRELARLAGRNELAKLSAEIAAREQALDALCNPPGGAGLALGHARKEWGHASGTDDPERRSYYFRIVRRDLRTFDDILAAAPPAPPLKEER